MMQTLPGFTWAVSVAEAANPIFKGLAILGGAAFGALLVGAVGQLATRMLTTKKPPVWGVRVMRLLGGVVGGWLIALWVFSGGGSGLGGSGGLGIGGNGKENPSEKKTEEKPPKKADTKPSVTTEPVEVEVLGDVPLKAILGMDFDKDRCYRVRTAKGVELLPLEQLQTFLRDRRAKAGELKVIVVRYSDSPGRRNPYVTDLMSWLDDLKKDLGKVLTEPRQKPDQKAPLEAPK
jgi:hypothetical protein